MKMDFSLVPGSFNRITPYPGWQFRFDDNGVMFHEKRTELWFWEDDIIEPRDDPRD